MRVLLLTLLALPLFAAQHIVLTDGDTGAYNPPDEAPWTALGNRRLEGLINLTNWDCTGGAAQELWEFGLRLTLTCDGDDASRFYVQPRDQQNQSAFIDPAADGRTWVLIRAQYDYTGELRDTLADDFAADDAAVYLEVWGADGTNYELKIDNRSINSGTSSDTGNQNVGQNDVIADIAWIRQCEELVPVGPLAPPPSPYGDCGDLGSWDFEGDLDDDSGLGMDLSMSGHTFDTTPDFDPIANMVIAGEAHWQTAPVVRAGETVTLDGTNSVTFYSTSGLSCVWSDPDEGPAPIVFIGSTESCSTTAAFPVFGQYTVRLTVTDDNAATDVKDFIVGAVATDSKEAVVLPTEDLAFLFGDMLALGNSAWPMIDERHQVFSEYFGATQAGPAWESEAITGTVSVTNGSAVVTGSGTDFQNDFCSGGSSPPAAGSQFNYIKVGDNHYKVTLSACDSSTQLTLTANWNQATASGLTMVRWDTNVGRYTNNSDNENFYDAVLAQYAMYYRSGRESARDYARQLAEWWMDSPAISHGECGNGPTDGCVTTRVASLVGVMAWAEETGTEATVWPELDGIITEKYGDDGAGPWGMSPEVRQEGYILNWLAIGRRLDPDSGRRAAYEALIDDLTTDTPTVAGLGSLNPDTNYRSSDGCWLQQTGSSPSAINYISWADSEPNVDVTNGSVTINCNAADTCEFVTNGVEAGWRFAVARYHYHDAWFDSADGFATYEVATVNEESLTLTENYAGETGSGLNFRLNSRNITNIQPFMQQMPALGYHWLYEDGYADRRDVVVDTGFGCLMTKAWDEGYSSVVYKTDENEVCTALIAAETYDGPQSDTTTCQYDTGRTQSNARYLNMEASRAVALAYKYAVETESKDSEELAAYKDWADTYIGAPFGYYGGPNTDEYQADEIMTGTWQADKDKGFGFSLGYGGGWAWDAIRLGGVDAESLVSYSVPIDVGAVTDAVDADVTLYEPKGTVSRDVNDQTGSTVAVTGDSRQGQHMARIIYRDSMGDPLQTDYAMVETPAGSSGAAVEITGSVTITGTVSF